MYVDVADADDCAYDWFEIIAQRFFRALWFPAVSERLCAPPRRTPLADNVGLSSITASEFHQVDWLYSLQAAVLGIVEGLTEFLPISSTGHLIIASDIVGFAETPGADEFVVAIQSGAILAVCWYYRARILSILRGLFSNRKEQRLAINTIVAFLPAAVIGVLVAGGLKAY